VYSAVEEVGQGNTGAQTLTLSNLSFAIAFSSGLEFIQSIHNGKDLYGTDRREHMSIMTWSCAKAATLVLTREYEIYGCLPWESIGMTKEV
jgi:hypothetical protein